MPANSDELAEAVRVRMAEQGWSQATVIRQGGPSTTSLTKFLRGKGNLSARLLAQLDDGLQWQSGTSATILSGHAPHNRVDKRTFPESLPTSLVEMSASNRGRDSDGNIEMSVEGRADNVKIRITYSTGSDDLTVKTIDLSTILSATYSMLRKATYSIAEYEARVILGPLRSSEAMSHQEDDQ